MAAVVVRRSPSVLPPRQVVTHPPAAAAATTAGLQVRGRKALVLEADFAAPLGLIAEALSLKEHGVEMCVGHGRDSGESLSPGRLEGAGPREPWHPAAFGALVCRAAARSCGHCRGWTAPPPAAGRPPPLPAHLALPQPPLAEQVLRAGPAALCGGCHGGPGGASCGVPGTFSARNGSGGGGAHQDVPGVRTPGRGGDWARGGLGICCRGQLPCGRPGVVLCLPAGQVQYTP